MKTTMTWLRALCLLAITLLSVSCSTSSNSTTPPPTTTAPSIAVLKGTVSVRAGSTTTVNDAVVGSPSTTDFSITNAGTAALTISAVTVAGTDFSISSGPAQSVAPGASTPFSVKFGPTTVGTKTAKVTIVNNTGTSFVFVVSAVATATPTPSMVVSQGASAIDADSTRSVNDAVIGVPTDTVFTIRNSGSADLTISGVTVAGADFSVSQDPDASVAPGGSTTFSIEFNPTTLGTKTATVTIANNANTSFSFSVSAVATATPSADISVEVDGVAIASSDTLSFGSVAVGTTLDKTLTIRNLGTADLDLASDPLVTGNAFALTTGPDSLTIAAGATTTFVVSFAPTVSGDQTGSLGIANDSADNADFAIDLTGTGVIAATALTVTGPNGATSITASGGTLQLTATVTPAGAAVPELSWTSSDPTVATVDSAGLVTAVKNGATDIVATAADGSGLTGSLSVTVAVPVPFVYFVQQALGTTTASMANGIISVASTYGPSGNAFKYVAPNYYGTTSNGFISFPTPMTGDFSITAEVTVTAQNKANNACGIGVGLTTGYNGTDSYAYILMRNATNVTNGYYVSGAGAVSAGSPSVPFTNGTPLQLTFSRVGTNLTYGAGPVGGAITTQTAATSFFTNGTSVYGGGAVYPTLSFNNLVATITNLVIKDGTGATVYDSATGALVTYVPASLSLSSSTASITKGASVSLTASARGVGGALSSVTAVSADPTIASVSVSNGPSNSTLNLTGVNGGVTTVTVTNTSDSNSATNTKTIVVAVDDYATADNYGSLATAAYPAPGTANAYTDGELALTFDNPPTLNTGGTIKIYKLSDGSAVDSVAFTGETQTYGTTTINVGTQLVRVSGNTVFFTPHVGKLAYATAYYVVIPTTSISGTLNAAPFNGFSNLNSVATWSFTTKPAPTLNSASVTVDGSQTANVADFRTVFGALNALSTALPGATNVTINVAAGTYRELVRYTGPGLTQTINIVGPAGNTKGDTCVIQYTNGNSMNGTTQTRASFYVTGANLVLQNVTLKNTGVRAAVAQAESLYFASGPGSTLAAYNSSFSSNQDTIQTSGRNWFYNCHIEGNVDFIWGTADAALFENCDLRVINDLGTAASYSIFVARTGTTIAAGGNGTLGKGYVLLNSSVGVDDNVTAFFGRDAGTGAFYDQVALLGVTFAPTLGSALGSGVIGAGIWNITTAPLSLGDASYVGWKAANCSGLNLAALTTAAGTSASINSQPTEYDTRNHILNRVVIVTGGVPVGFADATSIWDVSALATAFGAP